MHDFYIFKPYQARYVTCHPKALISFKLHDPDFLVLPWETDEIYLELVLFNS